MNHTPQLRWDPGQCTPWKQSELIGDIEMVLPHKDNNTHSIQTLLRLKINVDQVNLTFYTGHVINLVVNQFRCRVHQLFLVHLHFKVNLVATVDP